ncbi:TetR/AcrR family transcriptional regulator (plasmid) [Streptomyces sp. FXJ1.172]|uniref:TetR/AcrR family transcriptional regulator n=1 Tax=Streptomyces sp. FXJ1.172 TaxID=710705 RepID=UPI0023DD408A|nr:TetR/AcrR family transcriptional regulator [Streptomyces sp. FXJ1.172]WEP01092.1 TetR/AcrR family transcriptional regulator [Streptomyces sp. FXJ1.172]
MSVGEPHLDDGRWLVQERSRRTRQQVLDGAAAEFVLYGYGDATMQAVASRIGMTKGALYAHFDSKECLALELVRQFTDSWTDAGQASGETAADTLHRLTGNLAKGLSHDVRVRAAVRLLADGAEVPGTAAALAQVRQRLTELIRHAQQEGAVVARHPAEAIARMLLAYAWAWARTAPEADRRTHQPGVCEVVSADWDLLCDLLWTSPPEASPLRTDRQPSDRQKPAA